MNDFLKILTDSAFLGALAGAAISGLAALGLNSRDSKKSIEKEKEEANKVLLIIKYQAIVIDEEISKIVKNLESVKSIYDPFLDLEYEEDPDGNTWVVNEPLDYVFGEYIDKVRPYFHKANKSIPKVLESYRKIDQVNINALSLNQIDAILQFKSHFTKFIDPILVSINQGKAANRISNITPEEINRMKTITENIIDLTNRK